MAVRAAGLIIYRQVGVVGEYLMMQTSYGKFHWTQPKGTLFFIQKSYPDFNILLKSPLFLGGALGLILLGVLISWVSTYYVVKKHLRMRLDDLY